MKHIIVITAEQLQWHKSLYGNVVTVLSVEKKFEAVDVGTAKMLCS